MKGLYLFLDVMTILPPLMFSFHPRIGFYRCWRSFLPSMAIVAAIFLVWDSYFTKTGVWEFNSRYLLDIPIGNLPLEEYLFFICIPYACVFTLFCMRRWSAFEPSRVTVSATTWLLAFVLTAVGVWNWHCRYTCATFLSLAALLSCFQVFRPDNWLGRFYKGWLILLVPLVVVDGVLTGTGLSSPVVCYRAQDVLGLRLGTIPVEDFLYGMELVMLNVVVYDILERKRARKKRGPMIALL